MLKRLLEPFFYFPMLFAALAGGLPKKWQPYCLPDCLADCRPTVRLWTLTFLSKFLGYTIMGKETWTDR